MESTTSGNSVRTQRRPSLNLFNMGGSTNNNDPSQDAASGTNSNNNSSRKGVLTRSSSSRRILKRLVSDRALGRKEFNMLDEKEQDEAPEQRSIRRGRSDDVHGMSEDMGNVRKGGRRSPLPQRRGPNRPAVEVSDGEDQDDCYKPVERVKWKFNSYYHGDSQSWRVGGGRTGDFDSSKSAKSNAATTQSTYSAEEMQPDSDDDNDSSSEGSGVDPSTAAATSSEGSGVDPGIVTETTTTTTTTTSSRNKKSGRSKSSKMKGKRKSETGKAQKKKTTLSRNHMKEDLVGSEIKTEEDPEATESGKVAQEGQVTDDDDERLDKQQRASSATAGSNSITDSGSGRGGRFSRMRRRTSLNNNITDVDSAAVTEEGDRNIESGGSTLTKTPVSGEVDAGLSPHRRTTGARRPSVGGAVTSSTRTPAASFSAAELSNHSYRSHSSVRSRDRDQASSSSHQTRRLNVDTVDLSSHSSGNHSSGKQGDQEKVDGPVAAGVVGGLAPLTSEGNKDSKPSGKTQAHPPLTRESRGNRKGSAVLARALSRSSSGLFRSQRGSLGPDADEKQKESTSDAGNRGEERSSSRMRRRSSLSNVTPSEKQLESETDNKNKNNSERSSSRMRRRASLDFARSSSNLAVEEPGTDDGDGGMLAVLNKAIQSNRDPRESTEESIDRDEQSSIPRSPTPANKGDDEARAVAATDLGSNSRMRRRASLSDIPSNNLAGEASVPTPVADPTSSPVKRFGKGMLASFSNVFGGTSNTTDNINNNESSANLQMPSMDDDETATAENPSEEKRHDAVDAPRSTCLHIAPNVPGHAVYSYFLPEEEPIVWIDLFPDEKTAVSGNKDKSKKEKKKGKAGADESIIQYPELNIHFATRNISAGGSHGLLLSFGLPSPHSQHQRSMQQKEPYLPVGPLRDSNTAVSAGLVKV